MWAARQPTPEVAREANTTSPSRAPGRSGPARARRGPVGQEVLAPRQLLGDSARRTAPRTPRHGRGRAAEVFRTRSPTAGRGSRTTTVPTVRPHIGRPSSKTGDRDVQRGLHLVAVDRAERHPLVADHDLTRLRLGQFPVTATSEVVEGELAVRMRRRAVPPASFVGVPSGMSSLPRARERWLHWPRVGDRSPREARGWSPRRRRFTDTPAALGSRGCTGAVPCRTTGP